MDKQIALFALSEPEGFTPLHIAIQERNEDILELFLKTGISSNTLSKNGLSPLHLAVRSEEKKLILLLLKYGANVDAGGQHEFETPLLISAEIGNAEIVKILSEASSTRSSKWIEG